ncbi:hypothetical protein cypCar_00013456 [Cyprinus carpio]|nr:hypothetical protein cypCar_00013456 [Cyprinus carpio]
MAETKGKFDFAIDRGGTFTDVFARLPDGREKVLKLLSHDSQNYRDAPTEGIRRVLEEETGESFARDQPLDTSQIGWIRMGTTVATNALLERQGERTALLVTRGFRDLLHIGTQARPALFDLVSSADDLDSSQWAAHEKAVVSLAKRLGFTQVSLSSEVMPMVRAVPRGYTVCADAYLTPKIHLYLTEFSEGFKGGLKDVDVLFMQSDGGLTPMEQFCGSRAVLSGPAGGVVGYAVTCTSTDVSRYAGQYEHVFEATISGITLQAPQLDISTVAAG